MVELVTRLAVACLAVTFAWAAFYKLVRFAKWRAALEPYGLPGTLRATGSVGVPIAELTVVGLLVTGLVAAGAALALGLLALFCAALLRARSLQGDRLPCGCFGRSQERDYRLLLLRNSLLALIATVILLAGDKTAASIELTSTDLLPAALVLAGIVLIGWMASQASAGFKRK